MRINRSPPAVRRALLLLCAAALPLLVARADVRAAASAADSAPRIGDCRVGFSDRYKVGYWTPVSIEVHRAHELTDPRIELTVLDSDGVETTVSAAASGESATTRLYVKIGRIASPVRVRLTSGGEEIHRKVLDPAAPRVGQPVLDPLPATGELIVSFGARESGIDDAIAPRDAETGEVPRRVVEVDRLADLPDRWFGYESVDVFVLSAADVQLARQLAGDAERLAALRQWIERGGRIVLLGGGEQTAELVQAESPLAALVPGTYVETVRLPQATPLEHFSESAARIAERDPRAEVLVPRLEDVRGHIEVYFGRQPSDLPLVIRAPLGLGELTFAGVDLAASPLADWRGRPAFWQALLRPYVVPGEAAAGPHTLGTLGYNDLSGALRQRLGRSFVAVRTVTFPLVALLVVAYVLLLGPAHYWLVHRYGGWPALAWVVFPLLVIVASGGAYWLGRASKGEQPQVNQLELVDFDLTSRTARGTYWAALYSPRSERFDLALQVSAPGAEASRSPLPAPRPLLSWWGLPGIGVGGMQAAGANLAALGAGYRFAPEFDALEGVPVLTSATKSLTARWTAPIDELVVAQLADDDGMAVGTLRNETGRTLVNCRLLYGGWAYRAGDLAAGRQVEIGPHLRPIRTTTLVTAAARGVPIAQLDAERGVFQADRASTDELLTAMMFYRLVGGRGFAGLPSRYHAECDLSRLLELGRAILWAEADDGSELVDPSSAKPLDGGQAASRAVYRFILPVERSD